MATKKISELDPATALAGTELLEIVQEASSRKVTAEEIAKLTRYSVPFGFTSPPSASELLLVHVFAEAVTFPDNFSGARAAVGVNPTATAELIVTRNGTSVGTISVSTSGTVTFDTADADVAFVAGDVLRIIAPGTADATLANCGFTLIGRRT